MMKLKEEKKGNKYTDYNWKKLVETSQISDLTVPELNKYLKQHNLQQKGKKNVKLDTIKWHFYTHIGDGNVHFNSEQHVYNFDRNRDTDGEKSENEWTSDELSDSEDSDKSDENTFVLNIISDSDSENSVTDFPGSGEVLAGNNNPLVNVTLRSGRTTTRFSRDTLKKFTK